MSRRLSVVGPTWKAELARMAAERDQTVIPGTERSARQAAAARGDKLRHRVPQKDPGGLFEPPSPEQKEMPL